jgi:cytochrome P450
VKARRIKVYPRLVRDRHDILGLWKSIGVEAGEQIARLDMVPGGLFRPWLVTHPDHVEEILAPRNSHIFVRGGMMWTATEPLEGNGLAGEGENWERSRQLFQPLFSAQSVDALTGLMASAINEAVDELADRVGQGATLRVDEEMARITNRVLGGVFLGQRIPPAEADLIGAEMAAAFSSLGFRLLLPWLPRAVPLPGDRRFARAVRTIDSIVYEHIRQARADPAGRGDMLSVLAHAQDGQSGAVDEKLIRDDVVAMFVAGTETTALTLTWLLVALDAHPEVAERLGAEVAEVVGTSRVTAEHATSLPYTRSVLDEVLRLYPIGWILPRQLTAPHVVAGVELGAGATVVVSPYLTHRLPAFWPQPEVFDPERHKVRDRDRHRYAYIPFGGGVHRCLGSHFFALESALVVGALLTRFEIKLRRQGPILPKASISLRPRGVVEMTLRRR